MNNFREVNNDILKEWLMFREDDLASLKCDEDRKHIVYFDEISENILKNVLKETKKYVQRQLSKLNEYFIDCIFYWNEKYYKNGFDDGSKLFMECFKKYFKYHTDITINIQCVD